jgi:hypothetical protein
MISQKMSIPNQLDDLLVKKVEISSLHVLNSQPRQPTGFGHWLSTVGEGFKDVQAMPLDSGYEFHWMSMTFSQIWMGEPPIASCRKCVGFTKIQVLLQFKVCLSLRPSDENAILKTIVGNVKLQRGNRTFKVSNKKSWHCPNLFHLFLRFNVAFEKGMSETGKTYIYIYLDLVGALSHQRTISELKRWLASWCQERKATYMRSTQQPGKWEAQKTWSAAGEAPSLFCCRDVPRLE